MNKPDKCPKCGATKQPCLNAVVIQFQCGSMVDAGDGAWHDETTQCITRQRDQLAEQVKQLMWIADGLYDMATESGWESTFQQKLKELKGKQ